MTREETREIVTGILGVDPLRLKVMKKELQYYNGNKLIKDYPVHNDSLLTYLGEGDSLEETDLGFTFTDIDVMGGFLESKQITSTFFYHEDNSEAMLTVSEQLQKRGKDVGEPVDKRFFFRFELEEEITTEPTLITDVEFQDEAIQIGYTFTKDGKEATPLEVQYEVKPVRWAEKPASVSIGKKNPDHEPVMGWIDDEFPFLGCDTNEGKVNSLDPIIVTTNIQVRRALHIHACNNLKIKIRAQYLNNLGKRVSIYAEEVIDCTGKLTPKNYFNL